METVVRKMEDIEKTQADQGERLLEQEASTRKNSEKIEETEKRTTAIEKQICRQIPQEGLGHSAVCG